MSGVIHSYNKAFEHRWPLTEEDPLSCLEIAQRVYSRRAWETRTREGTPKVAGTSPGNRCKVFEVPDGPEPSWSAAGEARTKVRWGLPGWESPLAQT